MAFTKKSDRTTGCKQLPYFVRSWPLLQQIFAMPFAAAQATIVLSDFARSELHEKDMEL